MMENRKDEKAVVTTCRTCHSTYHYQSDCEVYKAKLSKSKTDEVQLAEETGEPSEIAEDRDEELDFVIATYLAEYLHQLT